MHKPLWQKRIVITRPEHQAATFCNKLSERGAIPIRFPTIRLEPISDNQHLHNTLERLSIYRWVLFTSVNGVAFTYRQLPAVLPSSLRVAAIGPATASALQRANIRCDLVPDEFIAEQIVESMGDVSGQNILLLRAEAARKALARQLQMRGAHVDEVAVYRTLPHRPAPSAFKALSIGVDVITFTSSSTAQFFARLPETLPPSRETALIACIGPITAMTARNLGYSIGVVARTYTTDGLLGALEHYFATP